MYSNGHNCLFFLVLPFKSFLLLSRKTTVTVQPEVNKAIDKIIFLGIVSSGAE